MLSKLRQHLHSRFADQRGFTLVEIIVMSSVATIGVLSTLVVANVTITTSDTNEKRVAATNLAREGIELVRAARDSNWSVYARQLDQGIPPPNRVRWDCFNSTQVQAAQASPWWSCDGGFFTQNTSPVSYVVYPNVGNGVPWFVANASGNPENLKQDVYLLCQAQGTVPIYQPTTPDTTANPCPDDESLPYYRRITVERGKDLGGGQYSLLVKSYVTWPDRPDDPSNPNDGPMLIEEYITDWKRFE